ncbi:MAG: hypothetical protein HUJ28_07530 [Chromatiales bacterium]|nr:hypothetical protein [Chromatiales bacterium]
MKDPIVIIGLGQIGCTFANGFLKAGHPVYPVTRDMDMADESRHIPEPALAVLAVAEADLHPALEAVPPVWRDRLALVQNELLPRDWAAHDLKQPTVASVWFEKKKGQDVKIVVPTPVHGPHAGLVNAALDALDIPNYRVDDADEMRYELVRKNAYILTANIAGLVVGGTTSELWNQHETLAREVLADVLDIQDHLTGCENDRDKVIAGTAEAFFGDPEHKCLGRTAPARLERALQIADEAGLEVKKLREIAAQGRKA